jgi:hypothetical protein
MFEEVTARRVRFSGPKNGPVGPDHSISRPDEPSASLNQRSDRTHFFALVEDRNPAPNPSSAGAFSTTAPLGLRNLFDPPGRVAYRGGGDPQGVRPEHCFEDNQPLCHDAHSEKSLRPSRRS